MWLIRILCNIVLIAETGTFILMCIAWHQIRYNKSYSLPSTSKPIANTLLIKYSLKCGILHLEPSVIEIRPPQHLHNGPSTQFSKNLKLIITIVVFITKLKCLGFSSVILFTELSNTRSKSHVCPCDEKRFCLYFKSLLSLEIHE